MFRWDVSFVEPPQLANAQSAGARHQDGSSPSPDSMNPERRAPRVEPRRSSAPLRHASERQEREAMAEPASGTQPATQPTRMSRDETERRQADPTNPPIPTGRPAEEPSQVEHAETTGSEQSSAAADERVEQSSVLETARPTEVKAVPPAESATGSRDSEITPSSDLPAPSPTERVHSSPDSSTAAVERNSEDKSVPAAVQPSAPIHAEGRRSPRDFGWVAEVLLGRIRSLRHYPPEARTNGWEGRVLLRAIITEQGDLHEAVIEESSGYSILDRDALENLRRAFPLSLPRELGQPRVVLRIPIRYELRR